MNPLSLVFLKLRSGDDIVGYLLPKTEPHTHHHLSRPLHINVETDLASGRQMIEVKECLPPILVELENMSFAIEDVVILTPIRDSFREELDSVIKLFYSVKPVPRDRARVKREDGDKIVPFIGRDSSKIH
jgi:hypothetical protein